MVEAPVLSIDIKLTACRKFASENNYSEEGSREMAENFSPHNDGYEFAKDLEENCSWNITSIIVEDLDSVSHYVDEEMKVERKKWFEENNIQPPFPIGTEIKEGVIHHIYEYDVAYYSVKRFGETNPSRYGLIKFESAQLKTED
jgi:hypothetical protein